MTETHQFRFGMEGIDRRALLVQAAAEVDALSGHLGPGGEVAETDEGRRTRKVADDEARLPAYPDVYRIDKKDFLAKHTPEPVRFSQLSDKFNFYWVRFPIGLRPQVNWAFNMLEVRVEFNPGQAPHLRPKAYQILPQQQFQKLAEVNTSLEVRLNENFEFEARTGAVNVGNEAVGAKLSADAATVAKAGVGAVLGPFNYRIKKAKIAHSATGLEWVFWRLDGAEFFQEDSPELVTILQVPRDTKQVTIKAELQASRYFNMSAAPWQAAIRQIPAALRAFFEQGMPLRDEQPWDISGDL